MAGHFFVVIVILLEELAGGLIVRSKDVSVTACEFHIVKGT